MSDSLQVLFGDPAEAAAADFYGAIGSLEVEENADLPGAFQLTLPIATEGAAGSEDFTLLGDVRFQPYARIAVVATASGQSSACIFDGCVLSHKIHVDRGSAASTLRVWGQDLSCLMNLKEQVRPWEDSDGAIANHIFGEYHLATADANTDDDTPAHPASAQTLMQRATDAQFLRDRARRRGRLFRVCCSDTPGQNTGYFIKPDLTGPAVGTLTLHPQPGQERTAPSRVDALDFEWDVARPTSVLGSVLLAGSKDAVTGDTQDAAQRLLDGRSLADFAGSDHVMETRLTTSADSAGELQRRAQSLLREAAWFVKCEGETDLARMGAVLRATTVVEVAGAGKLHSGNYLVWSVRHIITAQQHRMRFVLVRNAIGDP
jgi:hypothetical protein